MTAKFYISLAMASVFLILFLYINSLRSELTLVRDSAEQNKATAILYQKALLVNNNALIKREEISFALTSQTALIIKSLEAVYDSDASAKAWADCNMPEPVYMRLRQDESICK